MKKTKFSIQINVNTTVQKSWFKYTNDFLKISELESKPGKYPISATLTAERNLVKYLAEFYNLIKYFDFSAFFSFNSMDIH